MINVVGKETKKFETINEFYSWMKNNKTIDDIEIDDKDAKNLYNFFKYYKKLKKVFCSEMDKYNNSFLIEKDNPIVINAINELIRMNSDGKFLRACLIALGYETFNSDKSSNKYLPLTIAYETFQTSILIHDDIIDNASVRRGKTTIPKSYVERFNKFGKDDKDFNQKKEHISDSLGICIGDLGFYLASKIIIDNYKNEYNFDNILSLYNKIVINTIKGEIIDVELPFNAEYKESFKTKESDVMEIYKLKTAWYSIIGPYLLGMSLAGANEKELSSMEKVLYNLGIAFQIKDDILGAFGEEKEIGKSSSSDISEFKQTILYSYLVENDKDALKELRKYYGKTKLSEKDIESVRHILTTSKAKEYADNIMEEMFNESRSLLEKVSFINDNHKSILFGFISYLDLRTK